MSLREARSRVDRNRPDREILEPADILAHLERTHPVLYEQATLMGLHLNRALGKLDMAPTDRQHYVWVGQLYEIASIAMSLKTWLGLPSVAATRLSAGTLYDMGQELLGDYVFALECKPEQIPEGLQAVQLLRAYLEAERSHQLVAAVPNVGYARLVVDVVDAALGR
jgi:hypothetical protein